MKKFYIILLLLSSCSSSYIKGVDTMAIELNRTEEAEKICSEKAKKPLVACAIRDVFKCTIIMLPWASNEVLGHETRHCFDGNWHE